MSSLIEFVSNFLQNIERSDEQSRQRSSVVFFFQFVYSVESCAYNLLDHSVIYLSLIVNCVSEIQIYIGFVHYYQVHSL